MSIVHRSDRLFFILIAIFFTIVSCVIPLRLVEAATFDWTQVTRWYEYHRFKTGDRILYNETLYPNKGYDVRPHQQLRNMFPTAIVGDGNNKETSDNLWDAVMGSSQVVGNTTNLTRAKDLSEDFHVNFIDPSVADKNYYFYYYEDNNTHNINRSAFPLTLEAKGPHAGESILNNNNLIAVGDDNTLWIDADGTLSLYNYPNATLSNDYTEVTFSSGPSGWNGATLLSKLSYFIGYEQSQLYFLEGDSTLHVFNMNLGHVRTDEVELEGSLFGYTLGDLVDGNIPNTYYVGWDLGAVVAFVRPDFGGYPPVPKNTYSWTHTARYKEDSRSNGGPVVYPQEHPGSGNYDVRPHNQLRSMFPSAIVGDGNNKETSDNLWAEILTSNYLIGNSSSIPRGHDAIEDGHYNFIDPAVSQYSYYFYYYRDDDTLRLVRNSFPLTLQNGHNAGQSLLNNDNLIAIGDDNTLWLDADNTFSIYNYPGGTLEYNSTHTQFLEGPRGWIGAYIVDKLPYLIGYEEAHLYFLEGDSTLHVYHYDMNYLRTEEVKLDGDLAGYTLGDIVDKKIPNVTYAGWERGPIIVMVDTSPAVMSVDHFRLSYGSSALTCNPHTVLIQACEDASCSSLYTDSVDVTLSPSGWVGGNTITFSGGSTTVNLAHTTADTVTLGVSSSTPTATGSGTLCSIDSGGFTSSCGLTFADSGFIVDVPDFLSAKGTAATISAVKTSDATTQCIPAFASVSKNIALWSNYVLPNSGGLAVSVNDIDIGTSIGSATTQTLAFDASGVASVSVNYSDAGNMRLQAQYTGSGADAGLAMTGSGEFIARPAGMCVQTGGECINPLSGDYANCGVFTQAGAAFSLTVKAVTWESDDDTNFCDNDGTPNYSATSVVLSSSLVSPATGMNGAFTPIFYNHGIDPLGVNTVSMVESEVGVFTFSATPPLYQGAALGTLNSTSLVTFNSQPTGRFIPDHFHVIPVTVGSLAGSCPTGNLYSGETTAWGTAPEFIFEAHSAGSDHRITTNYTEPGYLKLTEATITSQLTVPTMDGSKNGTDLNLLALTYTPSTATFTTTANGVMNYEFSALDEFTYTRSALAEVTPFEPDLNFALPASLQDSDGVTINSVINFSPDASGVSVRFGRLWLEDSYGPETSDLTMPLRVEYFGASGYVVNTLDDCTTWDASNANVDTLTSVLASSGMLTSGKSANNGILLQAPVEVAGTPDTGEAIVTYGAPAWLQGDYDKNGTFEDPKGKATFGLNRGHERIIFRKELH